MRCVHTFSWCDSSPTPKYFPNFPNVPNKVGNGHGRTNKNLGKSNFTNEHARRFYPRTFVDTSKHGKLQVALSLWQTVVKGFQSVVSVNYVESRCAASPNFLSNVKAYPKSRLMNLLSGVLENGDPDNFDPELWPRV